MHFTVTLDCGAFTDGKAVMALTLEDDQKRRATITAYNDDPVRWNLLGSTFRWDDVLMAAQRRAWQELMTKGAPPADKPNERHARNAPSVTIDLDLAPVQLYHLYKGLGGSIDTELLEEITPA